MKLLDRIVLTIYMFILTVVSILMIVFPFNFISFLSIKNIENYLYSIRGNYWFSIIGLAFLLVSVRFLISGIRTKKKTRYVTRSTKLGELKISTKTIEGLAQNVTSNFEKIRDIETDVKLMEEGVLIRIKGIVCPDSNIPETTLNIQNKVKEYIEHCTGLNVCEVKVEVNDITTPTKVVK